MAIQCILREYGTGALFRWTTAFPMELYKEIFRLKGWSWRYGELPSPTAVGRCIDDVVYTRLERRDLEELQKLNPAAEFGYAKFREDRWLRRNRALHQRVYELVGMARACQNWDRFHELLERTYPKVNTSVPLQP
jgi:hypothetical protein